jgi:GTP cyclohydrolase I
MKSSKAIVKFLDPKREEGQIASHMKEILRELGEDPTREGLLSTPARSEKALKFLTSGYQADIQKIVNGAIFNERCDEMVVVKDIEFFSLCEHHMLPFHGKAHVAYIPKNKIIGLSKIPRLIDVFARRLQVQERMTQQIAECIQEVLDPVGVRHHGGAPLLHDDARRGEAVLLHGLFGDAGRLPSAQGDARRVPLARQAQRASVSAGAGKPTGRRRFDRTTGGLCVRMKVECPRIYANSTSPTPLAASGPLSSAGSRTPSPSAIATRSTASTT